MKTCYKCKVEKELIEFGKHISRKDGHNNQCKLCRKQHGKQYRLDNAEHLKQCRKQWCIDNPDYNKQWSIDNPEYHKEYRKSEHGKLVRSTWAKNNNQKNGVIIKQKRKVYRQTEQGKLVHRVLEQRRRGLLRVNTVGEHHTADDIKLKLKLQHYKCVYCETSIKNGYEIDHIIPLAKGGGNEASNIQLLCEKCNRSKADKSAIEYAQKHGKLC